MTDQSRYRIENGEPVVDIKLASVDHIFDNRDPAPFRERDLDPDLVEYLIAAAEDLAAHARFRIAFWLEKAPEPHEIEPAFRAHFEYELERIDRRRRRNRRTGQVSLMVALVLVIALMSVARLLGSLAQSSIGVGLKEGLQISCWVVMWRPVEVLIYDWIPWRRERRVLGRLLVMPIEVRTGKGPPLSAIFERSSSPQRAAHSCIARVTYARVGRNDADLADSQRATPARFAWLRPCNRSWVFLLPARARSQLDSRIIIMNATSSRLLIFVASLTPSAMMVAGCGSDNDFIDAGVPVPVDAPPSTTPLAKMTQTVLVTDTPVKGVTTDPNLVNSWGLAFNPTGPMWVADNGTGLATVYDQGGNILPVVVTLPVPAGDLSPATPTGNVFNATTTAFMGDQFLIATEDGTIVGWQAGDGSVATMRVDASASGAVYKGLDIVDTGNGLAVCAANFAKNSIDCFDARFQPLAVVGGFLDPAPLSGFAPFNIAFINGLVYVSYAKQDAAMHDDVAGAGNGAVNVFDATGHFVHRLITGGVLNSPWAMVVAPTDYPIIGGDLIVGNFGDGHMTAFNPTNGTLIQPIVDTNNAPIVIPGLWGMRFGPRQPTDAHLKLFFASGPGNETHGLVGQLSIAP